MKSLAKLLLLVIMMAGCKSCKEEDKYHPAVRTLEPEEITTTSALLRGEIVTLGTESIIRKGFCWLPHVYKDTPHFPTISDNVIEVTGNDNPFTFTLTNLNPGKMYHIRVFVETSLGIGYGDVVKFTTHYETITDIDGNVYTIVKIGDQYWTRENLNVTRLRDGTPIPNWTEDFQWGYNAPKEPAMCWYENNREQYETPYGALYNWHAASHPLIAPEGWKVPTYDDYFELREALGGHNSNAGDRMKIIGNYWKESDNASGAKPNNNSDFSAYPAGWRDGEKFGGLSLSTLFSASTMWNGLGESSFILYNSPHFYEVGIGPTNNGRSLRLIKDE